MDVHVSTCTIYAKRICVIIWAENMGLYYPSSKGDDTHTKVCGKAILTCLVQISVGVIYDGIIFSLTHLGYSTPLTKWKRSWFILDLILSIVTSTKNVHNMANSATLMRCRVLRRLIRVNATCICNCSLFGTVCITSQQLLKLIFRQVTPLCPSFVNGIAKLLEWHLHVHV